MTNNDIEQKVKAVLDNLAGLGYWIDRESRVTRDAIARALTSTPAFPSAAALRRLIEADAHDPDSNMIVVWQWQDAPDGLRTFSLHGGDEEWVALMPPGCRDVPDWMDDGTPFAPCNVQLDDLDGGFTLAIGAHS